MPKILVLHGPNLNLLGHREPQHYGKISLEEINAGLQQKAQQDGIYLECRQSNSESELVEWIQRAKVEEVEFIIINPAAYTHTSIAIRDAFLAVGVPFVEVHISNVFKRDVFRHRSYLSDIAIGTISGLGPDGYGYAYQYGLERILAGG